MFKDLKSSQNLTKAMMVCKIRMKHLCSLIDLGSESRKSFWLILIVEQKGIQI